MSRGVLERLVVKPTSIGQRYNLPLSLRVNLANLHEQQAFAA
jgi:hypothetical protein